MHDSCCKTLVVITPAALPAWSVEYSGSLDVITHCALEETELTHSLQVGRYTVQTDTLRVRGYTLTHCRLENTDWVFEDKLRCIRRSTLHVRRLYYAPSEYLGSSPHCQASMVVIKTSFFNITIIPRSHPHKCSAL